MEKFELFNEHGQALNKTATRHDTLQSDEYFRVVHVWIKNSNHEFLIQQRNKKEDPMPYQWATTTGIPFINESLKEAALREVKEELGLVFHQDSLIELKTITTKDERYHTITTVYLIQEDIDLKKVKVFKNEVKNVAYASLNRIQTMIEKESFWDYSKLLKDKNYFTYLKKGRDQ